MFLNYLKIALRSIIGQKLYSLINILGLAVGFTCCFLIGLFVVDELGFDKHFNDVERIYRISRSFFIGTDAESREATNAPQVAALLKENYPELVESSTRFINVPVLLARDDITFNEQQVLFADDEFFDIFNLEWLHGNPGDALTNTFSIVLTESLARKYFGDADVLGQTLLLEHEYPLRVTGIVRDLPANTHLRGNGFISMQSVSVYGVETALDSWGNNNFYTFVKLAPGAEIRNLEMQFADFTNRYIGEDPANPVSTLVAMNLADIHLHSIQDYELSAPGSVARVVSLIAIAMFTLLIACINFMNLSTARYTQRMREVGLRKTFGASRTHIVSQFLGEFMLLSVMALVIAVALVELLLPGFASFVGKDSIADYWGSPGSMLKLFGFAMFIGLLAGSYPAFFLSIMKPARVLKGNSGHGNTGASLRNLLVLFQFAIAIALLVATATVYLQMQQMSKLTEGFSSNQILSGSRRQGIGSQWPTIKQELLSHPGITHVTASDQIPFNVFDKAGPVRVDADDPEPRSVPRMIVDYGFFETYGIALLAGRAFDEERADQFDASGATGGYILNKAAAREFGWEPEEAVGKVIEYLFIKGPVIGVVEDSNFESARSSIRPMLFTLPRTSGRDAAPVFSASIRINNQGLDETLEFIDATWQRLMPGYPLQRHFLNEDFNVLYQTEKLQSQLLGYFTILAIMISCFGLFGLASFNAQRRTKEVGVRKVMGGSVWSIVLLLTNDFSKLVLLSNLIAWPVAYFAMERWLENFAYRIDLTPLVFIGSGLIALCIAWVTVGGTAAKAASVKPVLALRYE